MLPRLMRLKFSDLECFYPPAGVRGLAQEDINGDNVIGPME